MIDSKDSDDSINDLRAALKIARERGRLPDDYKIPSKALNLLLAEAKEAFTVE
jgi:hypothetical protein